MEALFKQFDIDNKDEITSENIKAAMSKLGKQISDEELDEIMRKHDVSGDRAISLDEFKNMMLENAWAIKNIYNELAFVIELYLQSI